MSIVVQRSREERETPGSVIAWQKKKNQLDQRGNTFWGPIELVEKTIFAG